MLFNKSGIQDTSCKLVTSELSFTVNMTEFNDYDSYSVPPSNPCANLGINVATPVGWGSGCPRLYFPLDSMSEGTALGPDAGTIGFTSGQVNNAFHFPNPASNKQAYFSLGDYPSTSYCFPEPEICPEGVTFAFWLNLLALTGQTQGIITTAPGEGPGFLMYWDNWNAELIFAIKRDSDTRAEIVGLNENDFVSSYGGFGTWVHFIITYKVLDVGDNMEVYINGEVDTAQWRLTKPWSTANTEDYDGNLQLGLFELGNYWWATANIKLDELIIWEEQLPCDDAFRLYQSYN